MVKSKQAQKEPLLKMSQVRKEARQNTKMEEYELKNGSRLKFYPIFPDTIIEEALDDLRNILNEINHNDFELNGDVYVHLLNMLCIKHFTHLKKQIPNGFNNTMEALISLKEAGYYKEIINDVFLPSELDKFRSNIAEMLAANEVANKILTMAQKKTVELEFKNKDAIEQLSNLKVTSEEE